jgi:type I restriction enzyme S subunit
VSWGSEKLGVIAPSKPLKQPNVIDDTNIWQLNLDMVEAQTGRIIEKQTTSILGAGSSTHWFDSRHILYSKLRPYLNKVVLPDEQGLATTELVPMLPDAERLDRRYLAYYLRSKQFVNWITEQVAGAKMPRVSMNVFWNHNIPLPYIKDPTASLREQKRIAAILDKADAIRRKRQQAIQLADDFLRSVFLDMFGGESIERFNSLGDLVNIKGGGTPSKNVEDYWNGIIPWASVKDFKSRTITTTSDKITELGVANSATNIIPKGTIIIPTRMALGKVAISMADMAINQDLKALFINDPKKINRDYLQFFLESKAAYIDSHGKGATVKGITLDFLKGIMVPIPSIESQKKFSNIKTITLNMINKCDSVSANDFFNSLSQKAFAGEL